jgi:2-methylcitrate dehydratase PrpD
MEKDDGMKAAGIFAKFIVETKFENMDASVIEHVKKLTLKQVMSTLVGSTTKSAAKLLPYVKDNRGKSECGVYGFGFKVDVAQAALMNGFSSHASEMEDDQFPGAVSDVTVWPALLAVAEKCKLSGKEVIAALYVGQEVQNRIGWWASVGTDVIGICNLPFIGIYGATAACAKAFGLTEEETKASLGLAMVSGLGYAYEMGTDAHYWESALVCRNAVLNALMAKNGFTSAPAIEKCLDRLTGGDKEIQFDKMTEGLGKAPFYTNNTWIKKWGFCFGTHVYVDILADLMKSKNLKAADIEEVAVHFDPNRVNILDRPEPAHIDDSRFSIQHLLAYQLVFGKCSLDTCTDEALQDARIVAARKKIRVIPHPEEPMRMAADDGKLDVKLKNGTVLKGAMMQPYGAPMFPLTMDEVVAIYRKDSEGVLADEQIERSSRIILDMENKPDLQELFDIYTFERTVEDRMSKVAVRG